MTEMAPEPDLGRLYYKLRLIRRSRIEVCQAIRAAGRAAPILMLTARGQIEDRVKGLKIGADDYVTKPFNMGELMARVGALLRRANGVRGREKPRRLRVGAIQVDLRGTQVTRNGEVVNLSAREFQLLRYLIEHRGETLSRDVLLRDVWTEAKIYTRTVDMRIANLRQQLEDDPKQPKYT